MQSAFLALRNFLNVISVYFIVEKTCPALLPEVDNLKYTCTDSNKFRSICTYSCDNGYDITPGMSRVRVCTAFGTWRGSKPRCTGKIVNYMYLANTSIYIEIP